MILFIIFAILAIAVFVYYTRKNVLLVKSPMIDVDFKKHSLKGLIFSGAFAIAFIGLLHSIYTWASIDPTAKEIVFSTVFGFLFAFFGMIATNSFILYYSDNKNPKVLDKHLFVALILSFPIAVIGLLFATDGFADYVKYPLVNGFSFETVFSVPGWQYEAVYDDKYSSSPSIAFYAICILSGAFYAYLLSDHNCYLEYGKHGLLESTFLVALPAGIIGARIFYVIGEWDSYMSAAHPFLEMIDFHSGGLTILGGAPTGLVVGYLWLSWRHKGKGYDILRMVELVAPTILLAQAIGRWGNFFNLEVHGYEVPTSSYWWLPKFIVYNSHFSSAAGVAKEGMIFAPLFLIEGIVNIVGFFALSHIFSRRLKKYHRAGDLIAGYVIWYGLTRAIMEPLRHPAYKMGDDGGVSGYWSWFWALIFVILGCLLIVINHIIRDNIKNEKYALYAHKFHMSKKQSYILLSILGAIALAFAIGGAILLSNGKFETSLEFTSFNIGLILMAVAISFVVIATLPIYHLIKDKKTLEAME